MQQRILLERGFVHCADGRSVFHLLGFRQQRLLRRHCQQNAQLRVRHGVELQQLELRLLRISRHADRNRNGYGNYHYKLLGLQRAVLQRHYAKVSQQVYLANGHLLRHNSYQYRHYDLRQLRGIYLRLHLGLHGLYVSDRYGRGFSGCGRRHPERESELLFNLFCFGIWLRQHCQRHADAHLLLYQLPKPRQKCL